MNIFHACTGIPVDTYWSLSKATQFLASSTFSLLARTALLKPSSNIYFGLFQALLPSTFSHIPLNSGGLITSLNLSKQSESVSMYDISIPLNIPNHPLKSDKDTLSFCWTFHIHFTTLVSVLTFFFHSLGFSTA